MKKKILFIANEIQIGGATKSLVYMAKNMHKQYEPIILINKEGQLTKMCEKYNIKYYILNYEGFAVCEGITKFKKVAKKILFPLLKLKYFIRNKLALKQIDKLIDMNEISLIHTNVNRDDFGALLSKKYHIPHIMHLREFGDSDYKLLYLRKKYITFLNNNTDRFIAISNVIKENFVKKGIDKNKIKVIYNGVQLNEKAKTNTDKNLNILFLGGIQESKGQLELIEALNLIPAEIRKNINVSFYGEANKDYKKMLLNKIENYNLQNIKFHSFIDNIDIIMKDYNVGIMCSKSEAFGRVIVEYMTNKLITIVPNTGACPEIVTKNSSFIYKHNDYQDLADIIIKIYNMPLEERNKISQNGYERAKEFSDIKNAENIMKLYDEILEK